MCAPEFIQFWSPKTRQQNKNMLNVCKKKKKNPNKTNKPQNLHQHELLVIVGLVYVSLKYSYET